MHFCCWFSCRAAQPEHAVADVTAGPQLRLAAKVVAVPLPQSEAEGSFAPSPETASPTKPFAAGQPPPELPLQAHEGVVSPNHHHRL